MMARTLLSGHGTPLPTIECLPPELKYHIVSWLDISNLHNLEYVSRSWLNYVHYPPMTATNVVRKRLLKLYRRYLSSSIWQPLQDEIVAKYLANPAHSKFNINPKPNFVPFSQVKYLDRFQNANVGEEFRQWVLFWPIDAPIGFLGIDLPHKRHETLSTYSHDEWWLHSNINPLAHTHSSYQKVFPNVPQNHPLRKITKEERKSMGWGGFRKSGDKEMSVKVMELRNYSTIASMYIYMDGTGSFNGTVWTDRRNEYRWNDELDAVDKPNLDMGQAKVANSADKEHSSGDNDDYYSDDEYHEIKKGMFPEYPPIGWIEWLEEQISRLEKSCEIYRDNYTITPNKLHW